MTLVSFAITPLLLICAPAPANKLAVFQRQVLTEKSNGIDGELQLMQDSRLPKKPRSEMWGELALETGDVWEPFKSDPPRNAVLRIVDREGRRVDEKQMERPIAEMQSVRLYGDSRVTYLVTVDHSAGFGSYSGPITSFAEVTDGKLNWLTAIDRSTGKSNAISVMRSLKTVWRLVDASDGKAKDILEAACRPTEESWSSPTKGEAEFVLVFTRYSFNGKNWMMLQRREAGLSEFEDGFPARKLFP